MLSISGRISASQGMKHGVKGQGEGAKWSCQRWDEALSRQTWCSAMHNRFAGDAAFRSELVNQTVCIRVYYQDSPLQYRLSLNVPVPKEL